MLQQIDNKSAGWVGPGVECTPLEEGNVHP